jgi:hypothetical protein
MKCSVIGVGYVGSCVHVLPHSVIIVVEQQKVEEKINEKVYEIKPLPQIKEPIILREFKQKNNWYEGKHKKHRK